MKRKTDVLYVLAAFALIVVAAYSVTPSKVDSQIRFENVQTVDAQTYDTAPVTGRSQFTEQVTSVGRSQFTEQVELPKPHVAPTVIDFKVPDVYTSRERAEFAAKNFNRSVDKR